jgi:hypothetical protein
MPVKTLSELEDAEACIALAERSVADQRAQVAQRLRKGHDAMQSKEVLGAMEGILRAMQNHRDQLKRELAGLVNE